jgi:hypothetical protein
VRPWLPFAASVTEFCRGRIDLSPDHQIAVDAASLANVDLDLRTRPHDPETVDPAPHLHVLADHDPLEIVVVAPAAVIRRHDAPTVLDPETKDANVAVIGVVGDVHCIDVFMVRAGCDDILIREIT